MAASARKQQSSTERLAGAQAALEQANRDLAELSGKRNAALLQDNTAAAIALGAEIANLKLAACAHEDKISLLRAEAEREEQARRAKERAALIGRIEAKIEQRDEAMAAVAAAIERLAAASERAINLSREVIAAWSWAPHDLVPALLTPPSIMTAIGHEAYRVSYHARRYGGFDVNPNAGIMLPGSRCPRLEWLEQPERIRPMNDVIRDASEFAKNFLRTGKGSAAVEAAAPAVFAVSGGAAVQRSTSEQRLSDLLLQQAKAAEDITPAGEQEYLRIVSEIAKVQDEITATKQMETQHHAGS
jgi:hypothetical protein